MKKPVFANSAFWFPAACAATIFAVSAGYRAANPDWVAVRQAERLVSQNRIEESAALLKAARHAFKTPRALPELVRLFLRTGQPEAAMEAAGRLLTEPGPGLQPALAAADAFIAGGRFNEAETFLRRAVDSRPGDARLRIRYARVLSWSNKLEESIEQYRIILGENE